MNNPQAVAHRTLQHCHTLRCDNEEVWCASCTRGPWLLPRPCALRSLPLRLLASNWWRLRTQYREDSPRLSSHICNTDGL